MVIFDGMEIRIQRFSSNYLQSITYSPKEKKNTLKWMYSCVADGIIYDVFPLFGSFPHGRSSDNQLFDFILLQNLNEIHQKINLYKAVVNCDRAWERNRVRLLYQRIKLIIPCVLRSNRNKYQDIIINENTKTSDVMKYIDKKIKEFRELLKKESELNDDNDDNDEDDEDDAENKDESKDNNTDTVL